MRQGEKAHSGTRDGTAPPEEPPTRRARRLLERQEAHRRRIASALHDETGQMLAALRLNLASPDLVPRSDAGGRLLDETRDLADRLITRLRELTSALWPAMLDDLGLAQAAEWYAGEAAGRAGVRARFHVEGETLGLGDETARAAFEVVREATDNTASHARAGTLDVMLQRRGGALEVSVRDDGRGFDAGGRPPEWRRHRGGLRYAADRVELLGGELTVESVPGSGTLIRAVLPLDP